MTSWRPTVLAIFTLALVGLQSYQGQWSEAELVAAVLGIVVAQYAGHVGRKVASDSMPTYEGRKAAVAVAAAIVLVASGLARPDLDLVSLMVLALSQGLVWAGGSRVERKVVMGE